MITDKERESSTSFNMSLATLERIDILIRNLEEHSIMGNLLLIQRNILTLYKELYPFLNDTEKKTSMKQFNKIKNGIVNHDDKTFKYSIGIYELIQELDFWIREKLFEKGLLMAKSDNPANALSSL